MKKTIFLISCTFIVFSCTSKSNINTETENKEQLEESTLQNLFFRTNGDTLKLYYRKSECGEWGGSSYILQIWEENYSLNGVYGYNLADCEQMEKDPLKEILPTKEGQLKVDKELEQLCIRYIKELINTQFQPSSGFHADNLFAVKLKDQINLFSNGGTKELHLIAKKLIEKLALK